MLSPSRRGSLITTMASSGVSSSPSRKEITALGGSAAKLFSPLSHSSTNCCALICPTTRCGRSEKNSVAGARPWKVTWSPSAVMFPATCTNMASISSSCFSMSSLMWLPFANAQWSIPLRLSLRPPSTIQGPSPEASPTDGRWRGHTAPPATAVHRCAERPSGCLRIQGILRAGPATCAKPEGLRLEPLRSSGVRSRWPDKKGVFMRLRYFICDVFTDTRFGGNQLAVLPEAAGLADGQMQQIAREFNFSESTFVLPPEAGNTRRVRIFTPMSEVPFAGHPNLGTAFVLATTGVFGSLAAPTTVTFEEKE